MTKEITVTGENLEEVFSELKELLSAPGVSPLTVRNVYANDLATVEEFSKKYNFLEESAVYEGETLILSNPAERHYSLKNFTLEKGGSTPDFIAFWRFDKSACSPINKGNVVYIKPDGIYIKIPRTRGADGNTHCFMVWLY